MTGLFKYIPIPQEHSPDIYSVDYENLKKLGFTTILMDYDFTVTGWRDDNITDKTLKLFDKLIEEGFKVAIVTNAKREKVKIIEELTNGKVKVYTSMKKPNTKKLKEVLQEMDSKESETVIIGDLFITDISVGNKLGLYTILINPYTYGLESKFKKFVAGFSKFAYNVFFYTIGWFFRFIDLAAPNEFRENIFDIDYIQLKEKGYKMIIFDFVGLVLLSLIRVAHHSSLLKVFLTFLWVLCANCLTLNISSLFLQVSSARLGFLCLFPLLSHPYEL
jgi:HAD superfamily phosphatase (TIGR01668 family)